MDIKVLSTSHHRNGVSGQPFDVTIFTTTENGKTQRMIAMDFGDGGFGILDLDKAALGDIAFGSNSWRGDRYQTAVREAASKVEDSVAEGAMFVRYTEKAQPQFPTDDDQFDDSTVKSFEKQGDGYSITKEDGWSLFSPSLEIVPTIGSAIRVYGGIGHIIRGIFIDGKKVFYRTVAEQEAQNKIDAEKADRQREEDFEKNRAQYDADYAALPDVFKSRIDGFRVRGKNWRVLYEGYELFCCKEALKAAGALKTPDAIGKFHDMSFEDQKKELPDMDYGNHSGNTFGASLLMAKIYLTEPTALPRFHGALCPLAGCDDYGCWAASDEAKKAREAKEATTAQPEKSE